MKSISELRQDLVSGDWVVIATGRAKRPQEFLNHKRKRFNQPRGTCPFEQFSGQRVVWYDAAGGQETKDWWVEVIPNKYPAFGKGICVVVNPIGPYQWTEGVGFHEIVVTRDHKRALAEMSDQEVELVLRAYQERYLALSKDACVSYISIFYNHGSRAGATISHPHSQIIAIPVIPPDVSRSLRGAAAYFAKHQSCVHCVMMAYELAEKKRIVYENDESVAFAPYASQSAFEVRIFPKRHCASFAQITPDERRAFARTLRMTLLKLHRGLGDPDYNFFLHTAPVTGAEQFSDYHWHLEIIPKTAIWAGFEIGTGIEISTIAPEKAAAFLRSVRVSL